VPRGFSDRSNIFGRSDVDLMSRTLASRGSAVRTAGGTRAAGVAENVEVS